MQEDKQDHMKEFGPEIGIGNTSIRNDFGEFAPRTQEYGGNAGKTPEKNEEEKLSQWVNEVKKEINEGDAHGFIRARVNFDIKPNGEVELTKHFSVSGGYQDVMLRGKDLDERTTRAIYDRANTLVTNYGSKDTVGFPRRNDDALYVSVFELDHLSQNEQNTFVKYGAKKELVDGKKIVEIRYAQPEADSDKRKPDKSILLVLPPQTAEKFQAIVDSGIDPNVLRDNMAEIFVPANMRPVYDANVINLSQPDLTITAKKPQLKEIHLQVTKPGGERQNIPADKVVIHPGVPVEIRSHSTESVPTSRKVKEEAPKQTPEISPIESKFKQAEENTARLRADYKAGVIDKDTLQKGVQDNMVEIDGVMWAQGAKTGSWHKLEGKTWISAEPPVNRESATPTSDVLAGALILANKNPSDLTDAEKTWINDNRGVIQSAIQSGNFDRRFANRLGITADTPSREESQIEAEDNPDEDPWKRFGNVDWGSIGEGAEATPPLNLTDDQQNNWYRELAADWRNRPQTRQYWENRRNILVNQAGMTNQEIDELIREHTIGAAARPEAARAAVEIHDEPEVEDHPEVSFPMSFTEARRQLKEGQVRRAEEMHRRRTFEKEQREGIRGANEQYIPGMSEDELNELTQQEAQLTEYLDTMKNTARDRGFFDDISQQSRDIELELREFISLAHTFTSTAEEKRKRDAVMGLINKWNLRKGNDRNMPDAMAGLRQEVFREEKDRLLARLEAHEQGVEGQNILIDAKVERLGYTEQLKAVRGLLNRIESLDRPINQQSTTVRDQIEYLRLRIQEHIAYPHRESNIDVRVLREARARMNLHEFYVTWRNFDLGSEEAKKDITNKLLNLGSPEDIPDGDDFAVLLKGRIDPINGEHNPYEHTPPFMEGIPAGDMANRLQESGALGTPIEGHKPIKWNWNERAEKSTNNRLLKDKLRQGLEGETETAYRLASRSLKVLGIIGTLDLPVAKGNHLVKGPSSPMGGYIYIQAGRYTALEKRHDSQGTSLDDPGPVLSMPVAVGFGSDALRSATYTDINGKQRHLVNDRAWENINRARARGASPSELKTLTLDALRLDPYNPARSQAEGHFIDFKNVAYEQLAPNFLENFYKKDVTMRLTVRTWLLTSTWKIDELLDVDKMDFKRSAFNIVDPSRDLQIRQAWVVGVVSEAIFALKGSETRNTLLHPSNWNKFRNLVTEGDNRILTAEQFEKVEKYCREEADIEPKVLQRQFLAEFTRGVLPTSQ